MLKILSLVIIGLALFFTLGPDPAAQKRILFIGNSFTFGADVPLQVKNIAATSSPSATYHVEMVVKAGTSLEQHLEETNALARVREGGWDVVILQDASVMSFRLDRRLGMARAATIFAEAATQQGAEVVYFAHWAPSTQADNIPRAIRQIEHTYERLAATTGGQTARAGRVWQDADDAALTGLYAADGHHASVKGAYAAALAITATLGDVDVTTSDWAPDGVPLAEQDILRAAAAQGAGLRRP